MPPSPTLITRNQRILAGYSAGVTIPQLALAEEVDPEVVRRVLRTAGVTPSDRRTRLSSDAAERLADSTWLVAEYASKSGAQIAQELDCSPSAVYSALEAAGIARRTPREYVSEAWGVETWQPDLADKVVERYRAGEPALAIAKSLGVPKGRVYKLLRKRGVLQTRSKAG